MANREQLKAKYGDEQVLVVPIQVVKDLGLDNEGYTRLSDFEMAVKIKKLTEASYYIPRWNSDDNPDEVELISYISFNDTTFDNFFTYKRIKNGDSRGDGALSIGVGGHMNPCDSKDPIIASAHREIEEEIGLVNSDSMYSYSLAGKGFIRCKQSNYDLDHLGIHFTAHTQVFEVAEKDKMLPLGIMSKRALKDLFNDKTENWTKIILDAYSEEDFTHGDTKQ